MNNKLRVTKISREALLDAQFKIAKITKELGPYLITLTPSERQSYKRTGADFIKFLKLSHELALESPKLFPVFINTDIFMEEYFITHELWVLVNKISQLREYVSDTEILSGNRVMEKAITFYQTVKMAARRDIPGARAVFSELRSAFPSGTGGRKKVTEDNVRQLELFED